LPAQHANTRNHVCNRARKAVARGRGRKNGSICVFVHHGRDNGRKKRPWKRPFNREFLTGGKKIEEKVPSAYGPVKSRRTYISAVPLHVGIYCYGCHCKVWNLQLGFLRCCRLLALTTVRTCITVYCMKTARVLLYNWHACIIVCHQNSCLACIVIASLSFCQACQP
jgi:hypothetical protein